MSDPREDDARWAERRSRTHRGLGAALRALYANAVLDPPPDEIAELARQLDEKLNTKRSPGGEAPRRRDPRSD